MHSPLTKSLTSLFSMLLLLLLLLALQHLPSCTAVPLHHGAPFRQSPPTHLDKTNQTSPNPPPDTNSDTPSRSEQLTYLFLHVLGVAAAAVASATRVTYPPSLAMDYFMTITFYLAVTLVLAISLYVTYAFASPDMLLVGAAVGAVIAWRSVPRLWSTYARRLHWLAPMWRTRDGKIYRRVRRQLQPHEKFAELFWNGRVIEAELIDGEPILEIVEEKPWHWETSVYDWQSFVSRGRLGDEPARRAALALRMAYSVPLPLTIPCGRAEYYASRGALGVEAARVWKTDQAALSAYQMLSQGDGETEAECESRTELAIGLHIKMLLHAPGGDDDHGRDWNTFVTEWLFGEVLTSVDRPLEDVLAFGRVGGGSDKIWNLVARSDGRMEGFRQRRDVMED